MKRDYNDADVAFVRMMIPHHQQAVDAAAEEYHAAKSPEVKEWARQIWSGQRKEIVRFTQWLSDRGLPIGGDGMADHGR